LPVAEFSVGQATLAFLEGDITKVQADAIVNAANSHLAGGGGVDGAIHRVGGPSIMAELDKIRAAIGHCAAGDAVITNAGNLPAKYVIHTVGPVYRDGKHGEPAKLASCYATSMRLAQEHGALTVSFPSISTGVYGYPMQDAAQIAIETVAGRLRQSDCTIEKAIFVLFGKAAYDTHLDVARRELS
jgi:O-acetyl-ADP-ribose deacetylase (regulator of RNase III)